jgi:hypothetical protein
MKISLLILIMSDATQTPLQWWQVAAGILAIPATLIGLIYSYVLLKKTRLEIQVLEIQLRERQSQAIKIGGSQTTDIKTQPTLPTADETSNIPIDSDVNQSITAHTDEIGRLSPFPKILRLHILFIVLLSALMPGLGSLLIRGWKAAGMRSICLLLAIPIAFLVFGPLWGEVIFASASMTVRELGLWPFLIICLSVSIISVSFALQDREHVLAITDA